MNIQDNRETANKAVREWKSHHQQTYSDFKRQVAAIGSGDLSLMERTMTSWLLSVSSITQ